MRGLLLLGSSMLLPLNFSPLLPFCARLNPNLKRSLHPTNLSPPISALPSRPPLLSDLPSDLNSYSDLASKLVQDGRFDDFSLMAVNLTASGPHLSQFVSAGISGLLREGRLHCAVEVLKKVEMLGVCSLELFDRSTMELLSQECRRILNCGQVGEVVGLMETLHGFHFPVKELLEPIDIIKICVKRRKPNLAVRCACILPHAHILFCTIIHEFGKKGDLVSALIAFEASNEKLVHPSMYAYRTMIDVCGLCGDYQKSRYIYEELLAQNVTPNIYVFNSLMNVNAHDLSYTFSVYKNMQNLGVKADVASYNILLKACCVTGRVDMAQDIYRQVQHLESTGKMKLDVYTYSTIIKAFADAKLWQMALKIKEDMLSAGIIPNTVTWSALISSCANAGIIEQAVKLFEEMLLAGCKPNSQCYNTLLHACVETCQYDRAFRLFQSWKGSRFREISGGSDFGKTVDAELKHQNNVSEMTNGLYNSGHFSFITSFAFTPTTTTYNILMKACGTDYHRAKALMDEMKTEGLTPNLISWSILIDICGSTGNIEGSVRILKSMRDSGVKLDVVAYTTVIKHCVESKNLKLAFSLFSEMKRHQIKPNLVTYNTLLRARSRYGSLHEVQQCLAIYQDMRKAGYNANDYYLKELIEEWCEEVIQDNNLNQNKFSASNGADSGRSQGLLLEKVAAHLLKSNVESLTIDLQGLTQVEARIVVLAVLQMIKENYTIGYPIKDDISIILGRRNIGTSPVKYVTEVTDAIIKLLKDELGLEVVSAGPKTAVGKSINFGSLCDPDPNLQESLGRDRLLTEVESSARRPVVLERFKVTKESLDCWLQRRIGAVKM